MFFWHDFDTKSLKGDEMDSDSIVLNPGARSECINERQKLVTSRIPFFSDVNWNLLIHLLSHKTQVTSSMLTSDYFTYPPWYSFSFCASSIFPLTSSIWIYSFQLTGFAVCCYSHVRFYLEMKKERIQLLQQTMESAGQQSRWGANDCGEEQQPRCPLAGWGRKGRSDGPT